MSNRILSYKGLIASDGQDTILLTTKKGEVGYRITKFQIMFSAPGSENAEHVVKIYKEPQSTVDGLIDFSDNRLLGAAYIKERGADYYGHGNGPIIFDQEIVNQDIYVTHQAITAGGDCNYYLELEVIKLSEDQAMVATLKDIRNNS